MVFFKKEKETIKIKSCNNVIFEEHLYGVYVFVFDADSVKLRCYIFSIHHTVSFVYRHN